MKRQTVTQPVAPLPTQQVQTLTCWHTLSPERRQNVIIALTTVAVKCLPKPQRPREGHDE